MSMNFKISVQCSVFSIQSKLSTDHCDLITLFVENNGVEPLTSCVQGRRSSQLS